MNKFDSDIFQSLIILLKESKLLSDSDLAEIKEFPYTVAVQATIDLLIKKNIFTEEELISAYEEILADTKSHAILAELSKVAKEKIN